MAHASPRWIACLACAMLAGCQLLVGIPDVTLATDGGGGSGGSGCEVVRPGPSMVRIDALLGSYCIDTTEVTVSQFNAFVIATGGALAGTPAACTAAVMTPPVDNAPADQNLPIGNLGECHAWAYCQWAGKRLCGAIGTGATTVGVDPRNTEWMYACVGGVQNLAYPYGSTDEPQTCNIDNPNGPVPVGSLPGCTGIAAPFDQIYDLVGNATEFVNDFGSDGDSVAAHGGSWMDTGSDLDGEGGGCAFSKGFNGVLFDFEQSGFRCCADLTP